MKLGGKKRLPWTRRMGGLVLVVGAVVLLLGGGTYALFFGGGGSSASGSVNLQKGLVGWWKMDGNTKDATPLARDAVPGGLSVVQYTSVGATTTDASIVASWPHPTTAGNTLLAIVTSNNGHGFTPPSGWSTLYSNSGQGSIIVFDITNASSRSGSEAFFHNFNDDTGLWLIELSGVDITTLPDIAQAFSNDSTSKPVVGPATTGVNSRLVFAIASGKDGSGSTGKITDPNWVTDSQQRGGLGYRLISGTTTVSANFKNNCRWQGIILSFNAASTTAPLASTDQGGKSNGAYTFDGTKTFTVLNPLNQSATSEEWSVSAWVRIPNGTPATDAYLLSGMNKGLFVNRSSNSKMLNYLNLGTDDYYQYSQDSVSDGSWHQVTFTFRNSDATRKIYIDGADKTGVFPGSNINQTSTPYGLSPTLTIGTSYTGDIADLRIYNRVLTASEAKALSIQISNSQISSASGEKGLVGWWKLDGNAKDSSPYAADGTKYGGGTWVTDRYGNNGAYSSTGNALVEIPDATWLNPETFTLGLWVKSTSSTGYDIIDKTDPDGSKPYYLYLSSGYVCLVVQDHSNHSVQACSNSVIQADNTWHYVTATRAAQSQIAIYLDGVLQQSSPDTITLSTANTDTLRIGDGSTGANIPAFRGPIDDVRLYNRVLTQAEIANQYKSYSSQISLGGSGANGSVSLQKGLVGWWQMNGNAKDTTPYSQNGTVSGASLTTDRKNRSNSAYSGGLIDVPNSLALNLETLSISAWFKTSATPSSFRKWLVAKGQSGGAGNYPYSLYLETTYKLCFRDSADGSPSIGATICTNSTVNDGVWHHVVATRVKDGTVSLYLDGIIQGTTTDTGSNSTNTSDLIFGNGSGGGVTPSWVGQIDDIRLYNRILNSAEVSALYGSYD